MKKIIALLLALIMVMGLATVVSAEGETTAPTTHADMSTVVIEKWFNNPNKGVSPAETFDFTIKFDGVTDAGVEYNKDTQALPTVASVSFEEGDAGKVVINNGVEYKCKREVVVTLPAYNAVGIYTYTINEVEKDTAGVTYNTDDIKLVVTVIEQDGKVRVAAVHAENTAKNPATDKDNRIFNIYESGTLAITKEVTGNLGDQEKEFDVTVTFTAPAGEYVRAPITYIVDGEEKVAVAASKTEGWTGSKEVKISLKHDETITFKNIPEGVTYTVVEADYTGEGYDAAKYTFSDEGKVVNTGAASDNDDTVLITNNKEADVDTGVFMDSVPFVVMAVVAVLGVVAITAKKRVQE